MKSAVGGAVLVVVADALVESGRTELGRSDEIGVANRTDKNRSVKGLDC